MSQAPQCPTCNSPMSQDRNHAVVSSPVPGWACIQCVGIIDTSKLRHDQKGH
jgi:hypothetical protein